MITARFKFLTIVIVLSEKMVYKPTDYPSNTAIQKIYDRLHRLDNVYSFNIKPEPIEGISTPITTVILDFEGTLYKGKGYMIDPEIPRLFFRIAPKLNAFSYDELSLHGVTGRPEAYGEGFLQSYAIIYHPNTGPHVFEKGGVIAQFGSKELEGAVDTRIMDKKARTVCNEAADIIRKEFPDAVEEPGKMTMVTFNAPKRMKQDEFNAHCGKLLEDAEKKPEYTDLMENATYTTTQTSFDIIKKGNTRKDGAEKLFKLLHDAGYKEKTWETAAYFGDSEDDKLCMMAARLPVTFPNARKEIQELVKSRNGIFTEGLEHGFGAVYALSVILEHDFYHQIERRNKKRFTI
jgi:hydroxymethylpyrimidine pyrophosphatase-like HAD family hydrolase